MRILITVKEVYRMKYVYEFIGTFFLVLTVGMTVINPYGLGLWAPLAIGSILAVMIYAGAHVSGGHYNPAVSLAAYIKKQLSTNDLFIYWAVQFAAGVIAALVTIYFKGGVPAHPTGEIYPLKLFLAEFLFTFALCFVFLNVASRSTAGNSYFGWAIGFTVLVGAYAMGAISSAAFNPAVALGQTILNLNSWSNFWLYLIANLLGGAAAAGLLSLHFPNEFIRHNEKINR